MKNKELYAFLKAGDHMDVLSLIKAPKGYIVADIVDTEDDMSSYTIMYPKDIGENELMPAFVAHTDTVSDNKPKHIINCEGKLVNPAGVLGADDRAGCFILSQMMKNEVRGIYMLFSGEECGGVGVRKFIKDADLLEHLMPHISSFIEFDRENHNHCATYGCDNSDLIGIFGKCGYTEKMGSYTDVYDLAMETDIACVNLSVGYYHQHSSKEYLMLDELKNTLKLALNLPKKLWETQYKTELYEPRGSYEYNNIAVCCEYCGEHTLLYYDDNMMLCEECVQDMQYYMEGA